MPSAAILACRLILAFVFATAGFAKLADIQGSARAVRGFGVPEALSRAIGVLLPAAELTVAIAFVVPASARLAAIGALALLLVFLAAIARAMASGRRPDCHCFGQIHSTPAGPAALARNFGLAGLAGLIAFNGPGPGVGAWFNSLSEAQLAWLIAAGAGMIAASLGVGMAQLLRRYGRLLARVEAAEPGGAQGQALAIGDGAPELELVGLEGEPIRLSALLESGRPTLLAFSDPDCGPCMDLLPRIAEWQSRHAHRLTIALVSRGDRDANLAAREIYGIRWIALQREREIDQTYGIAGTPAAILIDAGGKIASVPAFGSEGVEALVDQALNDSLAAMTIRPSPTSADAEETGLSPVPVAASIAAASAAELLSAPATSAAPHQRSITDLVAVRKIAGVFDRFGHSMAYQMTQFDRSMRGTSAQAGKLPLAPRDALLALKRQRGAIDKAFAEISAIRSADPARRDALRFVALSRYINAEVHSSLVDGTAKARAQRAQRAQQHVAELKRSFDTLSSDFKRAGITT